MTGPLDEALQRARTELLATTAPDVKVQEYSWSGGESNAIVVGDGPPLLLVHGGMGTNAQWAPILAKLAARHRVIAPDRPGNGLASAFDYKGADIEGHGVQFLRETMDVLALPKATLVGNSMGGRWAIAFAMRHPERVERLILVGAPAGSEGRALPGPIRAMRIPGVRSLIARFAAKGGAKGARDFHASCLVVDPARQDDLFWNAMAADSARNVQGWLPFLANVVTLGGRVGPGLDMAGRWSTIKVPVDFVWGEKDAFAGPDRGKEIAESIPGSTFTTVPDAGHLPWLDAPDAVAEAIVRAASSGRP